MNTESFYIWMAIFVPVVGSLLLPLFGRYSESLRNAVALICVVTAFLASFMLLPAVLAGHEILATAPFPLGQTVFRADALAVFMALTSTSVGAVIVAYSFGYISHYEHRDEYYLLVVLFLGAMMGIVYSNNLIVTYIFWEITAFVCWRLIGFFRDEAIVLRADKAFFVTMGGSLVMLIGFLIIGVRAGSFEFTVLHEKFGALSHPIPDAAVALILVGMLAKSATLPLSSWLPDAGVAPSPVTALLHAAVLVKIGVYVFARIFLATVAVSEKWHWIVPLIAGISAFVSAGAAMVETDIKRIIAYSTISQIGFIFLGLSINTTIGVIGGLLYILMHGIAKGGMFLCAGIVEQNTHIKDITKLGGLIKTFPITAISFLLCALSVMGVPPMGGFWSKAFVIAGAAQTHRYWIAVFFVISAMMTMLYMLRVFSLVFLGDPKPTEHDDHDHPAPREGSRVMVGSVAFLAVLAVLSGLFVYLPNELVVKAVHSFGGVQ